MKLIERPFQGEWEEMAEGRVRGLMEPYFSTRMAYFEAGADALWESLQKSWVEGTQEGDKFCVPIGHTRGWIVFVPEYKGGKRQQHK